MESDLHRQAQLYLGAFEVIPNPTPPVVLDGFCEALQATGRDLGQYSELEWLETFDLLGLDPESGANYLEQVASWGVTDVDTWVDE